MVHERLGTILVIFIITLQKKYMFKAAQIRDIGVSVYTMILSPWSNAK